MKTTLGAKIVAASIAAIAISVTAAVIAQHRVIHDHGVTLTRDTMRTAIMEAENVRESISALNRRNAFDRPALIEEFRKSGDLRGSTLYRTIPVVAAWNAIAESAAKNGFEFRVPKHQARNPKNSPTPAEEAILEELEGGKTEEYFAVDRQRNEIVYARPIVLSADCLACHGDPRNSPTGDGKDVVGFQMENWKVGEVHGAFVLRSSLAHVDEVARAGMWKTIEWVAPIVVLLGIGFTVFNRRTIVRPLKAALQDMALAADETATASGQVAAASQLLAGSASEQAASLEETSASLEEIAAMTKRNASNAADARALAAQTREAADAGALDMQQMSQAMAEIKTSSQNIGRIIKIIDEIAFQTNILALNAAVEAARAGDAGLGFAVVADEVRALAQRSAEAARQTAALIAEAIARGEHGAAISDRIAHHLHDIVARTHQVDALVASIAGACSEQNSGLQGVNSAIGELDETTQSGAAAAEECASTAEMLNTQAHAVREAMKNLLGLVVGAAASAEAPPADRPAQHRPGPAMDFARHTAVPSKRPPAFGGGESGASSTLRTPSRERFGTDF